MRILGIDPGLCTTGYGVIDAGGRVLALVEGGVLEPGEKQPLEERLCELFAGVTELLRAVKPAVMVVEDLWTSYRNPSTAVLMGHARGVLCLAAGLNGVRVEHLGHSLVKRALVGSGAAKKTQVARMVMQQLGLGEPPRPLDVSDALALAIAYANIAGRAATMRIIAPRSARSSSGGAR